MPACHGCACRATANEGDRDMFVFAYVGDIPKRALKPAPIA